MSVSNCALNADKPSCSQAKRSMLLHTMILHRSLFFKASWLASPLTPLALYQMVVIARWLETKRSPSTPRVYSTAKKSRRSCTMSLSLPTVATRVVSVQCRWTGSGRPWQERIDWPQKLYRLLYPTSYYIYTHSIYCPHLSHVYLLALARRSADLSRWVDRRLSSHFIMVQDFLVALLALLGAPT